MSEYLQRSSELSPRLACLLLALFAAVSSPAAERNEVRHERVIIDSQGWKLVGDWLAPVEHMRYPAVLLLHQAAGTRSEYEALANTLSANRVASLRIDLRANGDSTNLGDFEEPYAENLHLIEGTNNDINNALTWMMARDDVDTQRVAIVAASYSGEQTALALREGGRPVAAYVMLSPGNFSEQSARQVSESERPWLFVRTELESPGSLEFVEAVFAQLHEHAPGTQTVVFNGAGHATEMLGEDPEIGTFIADWIGARFDSSAPRQPEY